MKLIVVLFVVVCAAIFVSANEETGDKLTDEELQELINGYKDFNTNNGMSAPVS
jgi:hypothetical protein